MVHVCESVREIAPNSSDRLLRLTMCPLKILEPLLSGQINFPPKQCFPIHN